jgi:hypothetical protein
MDADHRSAVADPTETRAVTCARCSQTLLVLVSEGRPPSFREPKEQAKCLEVVERTARAEQIPDLTVCDALRRSIEASAGPLEVDAIVHDGIWYVVRRAPGEPSPLYSPAQARTQADLASARGQTKLADQFLWAADKAESKQFEPGTQGRLPGGAIAFVIMLSIAAIAAWYFLLQPAGHVAAERPSGTKTAATKPTNVPPAASPSPATPSPTTQPVAPATPATPVVVAPSAAVPSTAVPSPTPSATATAPVHATETVGIPATTPAQPRQPSPRPSAQPTPEASPHAAEPEQTASVTSAGSPAVPEPVMVALPGGSFAMGSNDDYSERPLHNVTIKAFAIGKFPITVREWNACVAAKGCTQIASGKEDAPVSNLSWSDTQQFVTWLTAATGKNYRLPSEAEWEYAARAGTSTAYWWGKDVQPGVANCRGCN